MLPSAAHWPSASGWRRSTRLDSKFTLLKDVTGIVARGHLSAQVTQSCSVTGDPLPVKVEEDFAIRFLPEPDAELPDEIELSEDECDTVFYTGSAIDLGEAAAETLLLALDPFPRGPNAAAALKAAGVISEDEVEPLGALAGLKDLFKKIERASSRARSRSLGRAKRSSIA
jgi:uncharacterized metal-binding protein YceD (DUF177 family)